MDSIAQRPHHVMIAEDEPLMRAALVRILSRRDDFRLVAEAANGEEAVSLCVRHRPDIVLMDIRLARGDGVTAAGEIRRRFAIASIFMTAHADDARVIALTTFPTAEHLLPMIRAGASGYLLKDCSTTELFDAMRTVLGQDGHFAISPALVRLLAEYATAEADRPTAVVTAAGPLTLTERETEVVTWLARGLSNRAIARHMFLTEATVKTYLNHITTKLGVSDRLQVLIRCYELGLVNPSLGGDERAT